MATITERLDRAARIRLLGIADLLEQKEHPRHRPKTVDAPLRRDQLVQAVLYTKATHPTMKQESIIEFFAHRFGVSRAYAFKALASVDPERRKNIEAAARAFAESGHAVFFPKPRVK
jgi:hypothetical protein